MIMVNPRKRPKFLRWPSKSVASLKSPWRKPQGSHSKIRDKMKGKQPMPSISYGAPRQLRYLHPSGYMEVLISNMNDLGKIDPLKQAARISSTVGKRKRMEILKRSEEMKIKVLNPGK